LSELSTHFFALSAAGCQHCDAEAVDSVERKTLIENATQEFERLFYNIEKRLGFDASGCAVP
jgi:hypothetical protein